MKNVKDIFQGKSESPLEEKLVEAFDGLGLPYEQQKRIGVFFVDFAFTEPKVVIEADGAGFHKNKKREGYRDSELKKKGWKVEHYPGWFVWKYPEVIAAKVAYQHYGIDDQQVRGIITTYNLQNHLEDDAIRIANETKDK